MMQFKVTGFCCQANILYSNKDSKTVMLSPVSAEILCNNFLNFFKVNFDTHKESDYLEVLIGFPSYKRLMYS